MVETMKIFLNNEDTFFSAERPTSRDQFAGVGRQVVPEDCPPADGPGGTVRGHHLTPTSPIPYRHVPG
jgi:hypothetical protein